MCTKTKAKSESESESVHKMGKVKKVWIPTLVLRTVTTTVVLGYRALCQTLISDNNNNTLCSVLIMTGTPLQSPWNSFLGLSHYFISACKLVAVIATRA